MSDSNEPLQLLYSLCQHILDTCGKRLTKDIYETQYQFALRIVGSRFSSSVASDEFHLVEKIKRSFVRHKRGEDGARFSELHRKLQAKDVLKNRGGILYLLQTLSSTGGDGNGAEASFFGRDLPALASTPYVGPNVHRPMGNVGLSTIHSADSSSGVSSYGRANSISSYLHASPTSKQPNGASYGRTTKASDVASMVEKSLVLSKQDQDSDNYLIPYASHTRSMMFQTTNDDTDGRFEVTEQSLMRDVLYVCQGIDGTLVKFDPTVDAYRINPKIGVPYPIRDLINRLVELGWLFRKVNKFLENKAGDRALGLVGQSFCAAIKRELSEYYRLIAVLEAQQTQDLTKDNAQRSGLTLRRLVVWTHDPLERIRALASLVNVCKGKKGGALLSAIYSHTRVGNPFVQSLIKHMLDVVSKPMRAILDKWIYDGELQDHYHEYFISADPAVRNERLWHEKYGLRKAMLPSFIPPALATKILNIGKSINFIRVVCDDRTEIEEQSVVTRKDADAVAFKGSTAGPNDSETFNKSSLQRLIDVVYKQTSKRLLDVMFNNYKLLDHIKAMRRYLLLGQGDFIRHLMDLLEEYLVKPANTLYMHNLTGVLETAIRATNAQYDDPEILRRLDCRLLEVSPGDFGWDVFSLDYHVDGPLATVFTPECMLQYLRIFNFLWRAKRMEYCLTAIWKNQAGYSKLLRSLPEVAPLLHHSHCLEAEMLHFIHQMQYYIMFEVLETCWDELMRDINDATDLDHVISAHETFLNHVMMRSLLDGESRLMLTQLRAIFDLIVQFQTTQESMYKAATAEMEARQQLQDQIEGKSKKGEWGVTDSKADEARKDTFKRMFIPNTRAQLRVLHQSYQDMLKQFLVMLNGHSDASLRFLCFRLDFNEHYKRREPRLRSPMSIYRSKRYKKSAPAAADVKL